MEEKKAKSHWEQRADFWAKCQDSDLVVDAQTGLRGQGAVSRDDAAAQGHKRTSYLYDYLADDCADHGSSRSVVGEKISVHDINP